VNRNGDPSLGVIAVQVRIEQIGVDVERHGRAGVTEQALNLVQVGRGRLAALGQPPEQAA
jgi:autotransporter translocation and assembly factor TamB